MTMRCAVPTILLLAFTVNGIACACPSGMIAADGDVETHHEFDDHQHMPCQGCDRDCEHSVSNETASADVGLPGIRSRTDKPHDALAAPPTLISSLAIPQRTGIHSADRYTSPAHADSPVARHDRMLD